MILNKIQNFEDNHVTKEFNLNKKLLNNSMFNDNKQILLEEKKINLRKNEDKLKENERSNISIEKEKGKEKEFNELLKGKKNTYLLL
jgi:hypothetical protein